MKEPNTFIIRIRWGKENDGGRVRKWRVCDGCAWDAAGRQRLSDWSGDRACHRIGKIGLDPVLKQAERNTGRYDISMCSQERSPRLDTAMEGDHETQVAKGDGLDTPELDKKDIVKRDHPSINEEDG